MTKRLNNIFHKAAGIASDVVAATGMAGQSTMVSKAKKMMAENKLGHTLYKQGYGNYYDSASKIAKEGKSAGKKRVGASAVYR